MKLQSSCGLTFKCITTSTHQVTLENAVFKKNGESDKNVFEQEASDKFLTYHNQGQKMSLHLHSDSLEVLQCLNLNPNHLSLLW